MALQLETTTPQGVQAASAYHRIDEQAGNKEGINIRVRTYLSKEAKEAGCNCLDEEVVTFLPNMEDDAGNFIKQGYEHLKTLPKYSEAIDA